MSISFPDLFKRARARLFPVSTGSSSPRTVTVPVAKPNSERLSKTVLPNMTCKVAASGLLRAEASAASAPRSPSGIVPGAVGFDATSASPRSRELPAAVALALEPKAERAISLMLSDILDQVRDHAVPQVETPFLQVTREDTERFRTSTSATPPKIPFHLPPNGTGAPASERVPALSGPPVPTALPEAQAPAQIPFKVTAPCNDIRPKFIRVPAMEPEPRTGLPTKSAPAKESDAKIALALTAVLKEVPAFQLNGNPSAVPEDVRVEFPLSLIEPQLASGRVVVSPKVLQNAMTVLRMRDDQEEIVLKQTIETPFSIKADEDAKRFHAGAGPVPKVSEQSPEQAQLEEKIDNQGEDLSAVASAKEEKLDAKSVVARANALPGVAACAITFADGLSLAGNLPAELAAEGLCAVAPSVLQKIDKHMVGVRLGPLRAVTLHAGKSPVTFLMHGNICLAALHAGDDELPSESRNQLATMVEELSRTYSQPEPAHVDH